MDTALILQYIDEWLAENSYRVDARVVDFALDVRLLVAGADKPAIERTEEPVPA